MQLARHCARCWACCLARCPRCWPRGAAASTVGSGRLWPVSNRETMMLPALGSCTREVAPVASATGWRELARKIIDERVGRARTGWSASVRRVTARWPPRSVAPFRFEPNTNGAETQLTLAGAATQPGPGTPPARLPCGLLNGRLPLHKPAEETPPATRPGSAYPGP